MDGLTEGRIVHYVMQEGNSIGQHRPAIVVNAWKHISEHQADGRVNLSVFTDFGNDGKQFESGQYWATSVPYSEEPIPGTWHWIEKA
jgi:hypothetical protein